jgi:hypothetical protein
MRYIFSSNLIIETIELILGPIKPPKTFCTHCKKGLKCKKNCEPLTLLTEPVMTGGGGDAHAVAHR